MLYRLCAFVMFAVPGSVPVVLYALMVWSGERLAAAAVTGTRSEDLGLLARAAGRISMGGLWRGYWGNGPMANTFGEGIVLSPVAWGLVCLGLSAVLGALLVASLTLWPGVMPHRSQLRARAKGSAEKTLALRAAVRLLVKRTIALWLAAAPLVAAALAVWLARYGRGDGLELMMPWRVVQVALAAQGLTFIACVLAAARWVRADVLALCGACVRCGYPRQDHPTGGVCPECGYRSSIGVAPTKPWALRVGTAAVAWLVPWCLLAWLALGVPGGSSTVWIPYDKPQVLQLASGQCVAVRAHRLQGASAGAPAGSALSQVAFALELSASDRAQSRVATREATVRYEGDMSHGAQATGGDLSLGLDASTTNDATAAGLGVVTTNANEWCVYLSLGERVTAIGPAASAK